jgi:hypothetical protein
MRTATKMNLKTKEEAISSMLKKYLKTQDNLLLSGRLFIAKSFINWIFDNTKHPQIIKTYIDDVERYINGEIDMVWKNGIITKRKIKKENPND